MQIIGGNNFGKPIGDPTIGDPNSGASGALSFKGGDQPRNRASSGESVPNSASGISYGGAEHISTSSIPANHIPTQLYNQGQNNGENNDGSVRQLLGEILSAVRQLLNGKESDAPDGQGNSLAGAATKPSRPVASSIGSEVAANNLSQASSEKDTSTKPTEASGRPAGDNRSAEDIIKANPILANLGSQKDINRDGAYKQLGNWTEDNKDPEARADAAYNAAKVLNYIDSSSAANNKSRGALAQNGDLEGITKDGEARHGTPAGNWKDFTEQGYNALKDDHKLDKTNDAWVKGNGSNRDNFSMENALTLVDDFNH
jgi:hypothetical protein